MKKSKGITLVALIITIIILLILAVITIRAVQGDNIISKAQKAKTDYQSEQIDEEIRLALYNLKMEEASRTTEMTLKEKIAYLQDEIKKSDSTATVKEMGTGCIIKYKGNEYETDLGSALEKLEPIDFVTLESMYGKVVNGYTGYTATDVTEWQLLYVDEENREAFIISSNTLSTTRIPLSPSKEGSTEYKGSADVRSFEYGAKYNGLWLEQCTTENQNDNAKATAYLCDPSNWTKYVTGKAKYAAGGPTLELLVASLYNIQVKDLSTEVTEMTNVTGTGYPRVSLPGLTAGGVYHKKTFYWFASPGSDSSNNICLMHNTGVVDSNAYYLNLSLRPIVCLPASAIQINGQGADTTLSIKP